MPVKEPGQKNITYEKQHLHTVKQQQCLRSRIQYDHNIRQKVQHKQTDQLSAAGEIPVFLPFQGETPEIIVRIDRDQ